MAGSTPASVIASPAANAPRARSVSLTREAWRRFCRHKMAVLSLIILLTMVALVVFGPLVWKVAINDIDFGARLKGPSWAHPFGTDDLGQDIFARMLYGGRISLARPAQHQADPVGRNGWSADLAGHRPAQSEKKQCCAGHAPDAHLDHSAFAPGHCHAVQGQRSQRRP